MLLTFSAIYLIALGTPSEKNMTTRLKSFSFLCGLALIVWMAEGTPFALASDFPIGSYSSGPYTLIFEANGHFRVVKGGYALVEGEYSVKGAQLKITDKRGPFACTGEGRATGTYSWTLEGTMLKLSEVEDRCADRSQSFAGTPWKKE